MAGTWMSVVQGFGGMRVKDGMVHFTPYLPENWESMTFKVRFRGASMEVIVTKTSIEVANLGENAIDVIINGQPRHIGPHEHRVMGRD